MCHLCHYKKNKSMKQIVLFICLFASLTMAAQSVGLDFNSERYRNRIADFTVNPLQNGQVVFLGDSLTEGGQWDKYFPNSNTANRGISGDNTEGMFKRIGEIAESKPSKLFILAGINDIAQGAEDSHIIARMRNLIYQVKIKSPNTQIFVCSVLPINGDFEIYGTLKKKEKQIEQLNKNSEKLCKSRGDIVFINAYPDFLIKKRKLDPKYTTDGLHLTPEGYDLLASILKKYVEDQN